MDLVFQAAVRLRSSTPKPHHVEGPPSSPLGLQTALRYYESILAGRILPAPAITKLYESVQRLGAQNALYKSENADLRERTATRGAAKTRCETSTPRKWTGTSSFLQFAELAAEISNASGSRGRGRERSGS